MREKKKEWEVQRRGEEKRRGMLCWRTGRGKPQERVRGGTYSRERGVKKQGGRGQITASWKERLSYMCLAVLYQGAFTLCMCVGVVIELWKFSSHWSDLVCICMLPLLVHTVCANSSSGQNMDGTLFAWTLLHRTICKLFIFLWKKNQKWLMFPCKNVHTQV